MAARFLDKLVHEWPPDRWNDVTIVLAVSGGADSVSLLRGVDRAASAGTGQVIVAHFNHGLRRPEADVDQAFVAALCRDLGRPLVVSRAEPSDLEPNAGSSLESAAREARYQFLKATAQRHGARFVATAHTADDQAETILHRIIRGTGLRGLGGIPRTRPLSDGITLIRPLLSFHRREVLEYLKSLGQPFREDSSNWDPQFTRNRIRRDLLPRIARDYNPEVVDSLSRLGLLAHQVQSHVDRTVSDVIERCLVRSDESGLEVDCSSLATVSSYLMGELFIALWARRSWPQRDMGFERWSELAEMAIAAPEETATRTFPGGIRVERDGDRLRIVLP